MRKSTIVLMLLMLVAGFTASAQKVQKPKKDTVAVPVYVVDKTDTVQVPGVLYLPDTVGTVKYAPNGYVILKGQVVQTDKGLQWVKQPDIIGHLDEKKKPVKGVRL